jgi:citrate lyase subunit beta/citryl-CoA lyase
MNGTSVPGHSAALPIWRSLLYVPANRERFIQKAMTCGADAVQLDLEDSIAPDDKEAARAMIPAAVAQLAATPCDIVVRINRPLSLAVRDIEVCVRPGVAALSLPKVESADHVRLIAEAVGEAEQRNGVAAGSTRLILGIESPAAWLRMAEIAMAHPRVVAMLLGSEDFSLAVGMTTDPDALLGPKQALVIAAAAAGVMPLGLVGSFANFKDTEAFAAMVARSRDLGFRGSSCIHPDQVPLLNAGFSPTNDELAKARKIVAAFDAAQSGTVGFEGAMLDLPVVERARATVALNERMEQRSATRV